MIDKIVASVADAVVDVQDGATVMIGGFGTAGLPNELTEALLAQGAKGLTIINNNAGNGDHGLAALLAAGRARLVANARPLARVLGTVLWLGVVSGMIVRLVIVAFVPDPTAQVASPQGSDKSSGKAAGTGPKLDCLTPAALATLNHLPAGTMMAAIDLSPALLVHSHQRAVAGPYHRNGAAIAGVMNAFAGTEAAAHDFIRAHHTDYVLICPSLTEHEIYQKRAPSGFQQQLLAGKAPAWLVPLPSLPAYRLFRVK